MPLIPGGGGGGLVTPTLAQVLDTYAGTTVDPNNIIDSITEAAGLWTVAFTTQVAAPSVVGPTNAGRLPVGTLAELFGEDFDLLDYKIDFRLSNLTFLNSAEECGTAIAVREPSSGAARAIGHYDHTGTNQRINSYSSTVGSLIGTIANPTSWMWEFQLWPNGRSLSTMGYFDGTDRIPYGTAGSGDLFTSSMASDLTVDICAHHHSSGDISASSDISFELEIARVPIGTILSAL